jgi:hypothetical protein
MTSYRSHQADLIKGSLALGRCDGPRLSIPPQVSINPWAKRITYYRDAK